MLIYFEIQKLFIQRKMKNFSAPKQYPIIGYAYRMLSNESFFEIILKLYREMNKTPFYGWFGPILSIYLAEPHDIQAVLTSEDCLNKPYLYKQFKCPTSILVTNRETWKTHRRALNASFNIRMLQMYVPLLNEKAKILVTNFKPSVKKCDNLYRVIFVGMMDTIVRTTMGIDLDLQRTERGPFFFNVVKLLMNNIQYRFARYWLRWDFTYSFTSAYRNEKIPLAKGNSVIDEIYDKRIEKLTELREFDHIDFYLQDAKERNCANVIDKCLILEREGILSNENVKDQMRIILLAGMDTSSITIFTTLLLLGIHQKEQEMVIDELKSLFDTVDSDVTYEHLSKLNYLERVIKETLRLFPAAPFMARTNEAEIQLRDGIIPKDSMIFINIMHMHRNPQIWGENVNEFDPDRFLRENITSRHPFSYIPFSGGPRNCIGMKYAMITAKIVLCHLLRQYKFNSDLTIDEIRLDTHILLEIINENPLRIEERVF